MKAEEQTARMEIAEKQSLIEAGILIPVDSFGGHVSAERMTRLRSMTKPELQLLAVDLRDACSSANAITMIVNAICASEAAQRLAEDKKYEGLCSPARTEMSF